MSRTFTNLLTHIVFGTKDREPLIVPNSNLSYTPIWVGWLANSKGSLMELMAR